MKPPGTFAFFLRWYWSSFFCGLALVAVVGYQLATYVAPKPSALDSVVSSPAVDFFVPLMWICLGLGLFLVVNAWRKARALAGR